MTKLHIEATVNDEPAEFLCDPHESLMSALRDRLGLTGTKEGRPVEIILDGLTGRHYALKA